MPVWRLRTLGLFALTQKGEAETTESEALTFQAGFKNYRTWLLLASLATDASTCQRATIAQRLWEETDTLYDEVDFLERLRPLLTDLVHGDKKKGVCGIGEDCLIRHQKTLRLKPGTVITDIDEAEAMFRRAQALPDDTARLVHLREAARQLHGAFLPGFDPPFAALAWYNTQTVRLEALRNCVWNAVLETAEKTGDTAARAEAWQRLQGIEDTESFALRTKATGAKTAKSTQRNPLPIEWKDLLCQLEQKERGNLSLTTGEEVALENGLAAVLAQMPAQSVSEFRALSVFPQSFTRDQAAAVADASAGATQQFLSRLAKSALLNEIPPTQEPECERRYCLPPFVAPLVFQKLHRSQRKRLRERHARHFVRFDGNGWPKYREERTQIARWCERERANYVQAFEVCLESAFTDETLGFLAELRQGLFQVASPENVHLQRSLLRRAVPRIKEALDAGSFFTCHPASLLFHAAQEEQCFSDAIGWANVVIKHIQSSPLHVPTPQKVAGIWDLMAMIILLLDAIHHAGHHAEFDKAIEMAHVLLSELGTPSEAREIEAKQVFQRGVAFIRAENLWARRNCEAAFLANQSALDSLHQLVALEPEFKAYYPVSYYQRGCIQWDRGHRNDALADWNRALEGFQARSERHGVADCKKRIGKAFAEMGHYAIGQDLIQEAIAIYAAMDKQQSRAAALGTLADVLVMKGEADKALPFYEEGLAYLRSTNHADWIEHFEASLTRLDQNRHIAVAQSA